MPRPLTSTPQARPILIWVVIQLIALGIAAVGIPFWPNHPFPRESLAIQEMIVVQIAAMAMVFPLLVPDLLTGIVVIALVWPFQHLAGFLSVTPEKILILSSGYVSLWIVGLWFCGGIIRSRHDQLIAICLAELFTIGGVILWYLHLESGANSTAQPEMFGPLMAGIYLVSGAKIAWIGWMEAALLLMLGIVYRGLKKLTPSAPLAGSMKD